MAIVLGDNRFGKAEVRMLHLHRDDAGSVLTDLMVSSHLSGALDAVHLTGDNAGVLTTDAQKNAVYAFARQEAPGEIESFGLRLARHFVSTVDTVDRAVVELESYGWQHIPVDGAPAPHSFTRAGSEKRLATVTVEGDQAWVVSGLTDLTVLRAKDSQFEGYLRDAYTTSVPEAKDRILATAVTARWRHIDAEADWAASFAAVRQTLLATFATAPSRSLQQTLYCMGTAVLEQRPEIAEVRLAMPNKHHFLADLSPFGLDNPMDGGDLDAVFTVPDRPYGLIEGTVVRDDVPTADHAWR
jgi:urate oxidase